MITYLDSLLQIIHGVMNLPSREGDGIVKEEIKKKYRIFPFSLGILLALVFGS